MPEIQNIPLRDIYVPPDTERQRKFDPTHAARLASLLKVRNILDGRPIRLAPQKIEVDGEWKWRLASGRHRYAAVELLGWETIPATFAQSNDPNVLADEEYLENEDLSLSSVERERAIVGFTQRHPEFTQTELSSLLPNGHQSDVSKALIAHEYRTRNPERAGEKPMHTVYKMAKEDNRRKTRAAGIVELPDGAPVLCGNAVPWMQHYDGPKFTVIHCDFPYGIDADKSGQNPATFDDSPVVYWDMLDALRENIDRICAADAHMFFWCSASIPIQYETYQHLSALPGFKFDDVPLIWHKSGNLGIVPDWERRPRRMYETRLAG
jgi:hypothetical protein